MDWMIPLLLVGGLITLVLGADLLVRGASRLAAALGISPLVIGLTVVAFGTSSPELAVSVQSAVQGSADIALGNVVGSNIFNILFILGLSAVITPLIVHQQLVRLDVPLMIGLSLLLLILGLDGKVDRLDGAILFFGLLVYIWYGIRQSRKESREVQQEYSEEYALGSAGKQPPMLLNLILIVSGLGLLVLGSDWLVKGAVSLAQLFKVSDLVIGLTIISVGTSMPEVATSIMAAIKKERDIAVGNVVGSNIFNIMGVLGLSSLISPDGIRVASSALIFDIPVMIAVALATLPVFFTGRLIARWEGSLFLLYYFAYTAYLIFESLRNQQNREILVDTMLWFVFPFTAIVLLVSVIREFRAARTRTKN
jgi:cation:H+ antiporter